MLLVQRVLWCVVVFKVYCLNVHAQETNCGIVWYPAIQLSDSIEDGFKPHIALSGDDTVHVTYQWGGRRLAYASR